MLLAQNVPEGRVFGLDEQTFYTGALTLFNGIVLAVILGWLLYSPVKKFLNDRTERIKSEKEAAEATKARGNELIAEYDQKIQDIEKERIKILEEAREAANHETEIILKEAQKEAQALRARASESIDKEKERIREETRLYIIELASIIAEKHIVENIDNESQTQMFEESLTQLEETQWQN